jgi:hypothetical protein
VMVAFGDDGNRAICHRRNCAAVRFMNLTADDASPMLGASLRDCMKTV